MKKLLVHCTNVVIDGASESILKLTIKYLDIKYICNIIDRFSFSCNNLDLLLPI